jgi:gas vesicle protein
MGKHPGRQFLLGAVLGSTVGAISAMMFTTKKGNSFKKHAMAKLHDFEGYMRKMISHKKRTILKKAKKIGRTFKMKRSKKR